MGTGWSQDSNTSSQSADATLTQQYSGTCDVSCENDINDVNIDLINTTVNGNVTISQVCAANGTCLFNNSMDATSDVMFKASNSANATDAGSWFAGVFNADISDNSSVQSIQETIGQIINQSCKVTSTNQMNDVNIFAANSYIGGNIGIGQQGSANGNCQLNSTMTAAAYATGTIDNCATSGKKVMKKCGAGKGSKSIGYFAMYFGIAVAIFIFIMILMRVFRSYSSSSKGPISSIKKALPSSLSGGALPSSGGSLISDSSNFVEEISTSSVPFAQRFVNMVAPNVIKNMSGAKK